MELFEKYFAVFPWTALSDDAEGFDAGCGSGRWAQLVAQRVARLHCVDASPEALRVARDNLAEQDNCELHLASVAALPLPNASQDFGYSLGVIHHLPDPAGGLASCVSKLKPGAPFLLYLYYAFDNRPGWFRLLHGASALVRAGVSRLPARPKHLVADILAFTVYLPLARLARILERTGANVSNLPLSYYRKRSMYVMRTDSLDRFGTPLEQRFTAKQIEQMMETAGLERITFSPNAPYWCAVGYRSST